MASQTDIGNLCFTILGKPPITNIATDPGNAARALNAIYDMRRRALIEGRPIWRFSVKRASLPALATAPVSGPFTTQYAMPTDCIRPLQIGMTWAGLDLSDYRMGPTDADYQIEGRNILCDYGAPLAIQYVADVTDTTLFNPHFVSYLAADLAWWGCDRITNSLERQGLADKRRQLALSEAAASNALVRAPEIPADDTWILARLQ